MTLHKSLPRQFTAQIFGLVFHSAIMVADAGAEAPSNKYEIPRSIGHTIKDDNSGRIYQVYVRTPRGYDKGYNKTKSYPVIYLNDAPYTFQVASGVTHIPSFSTKYESVILVGISYAIGEKPRVSRTWDLTPSYDSNWKTYSGYQSGGADEYLRFLEKGLMPFVEKRYRVDASRRTLGGHSFGGLFAAWVMFVKPKLFENYIISGPSLWFDKKRMFEVEREYAETNNDLKVNVYFGTGELEQMHDDLTADHVAFVKQLQGRNYPSLKLRSLILEDIDHTTAFPINFTRAVRWIFHSLKK
jgi:predicted alpha/beta superfamily hydrolase